MVEATINTTRRFDLQGRGSARLAHLANQFKSKILLVNDNHTANAKDVMQVMRFTARTGTQVRIQASGADEIAAVKALAALLTA